MYYEINIAKRNDKGDYMHHFATAERSITNKSKLKVVLADLMKVFTTPEYNISVSYNEEVGVSMDANEFLANPDKLTM